MIRVEYPYYQEKQQTEKSKKCNCYFVQSYENARFGYPDFHVIPTFQKRPTAPTALGRKVGITFCSLRGYEPAALQKSV